MKMNSKILRRAFFSCILLLIFIALCASSYFLLFFSLGSGFFRLPGSETCTSKDEPTSAVPTSPTLLCETSAVLTSPTLLGETSASGAATDLQNGYLSDFDAILPEEYKGLAESDDAMDSLIGPEAVLREILSAISGASGGAIGMLAALIGCIALSAVAEAGDGRLSDMAGIGVTVVFGATAAALAFPIFSELCSALSAASEFFAAFVPVATAVQASAGALNSAKSSAVGMGLTASALGGIGTPFFLNIAGFGLSVGLLSSFGDEATASLARGTKKFFMWAIGLICALIMGVLALQTFIASARDSAAMRAARYAATSLIPVVGGTVSGAMATLATGMAYVKSAVGVGALAVLLSMLLSPLVILIIYRLAVSVAAGVAGYLGVKRAEGMLSSLLGAFDIFLAVYAISAVLYLFEIVLFLMASGQ